MRTTITMAALLWSITGFSATLTVTTSNDSGTGSLRDAISTAVSGDVIVFNPGLSNQTLTLLSTLEIPVGKSLTIDGTNAADFTISGNNAVRVFHLQSTSVQPTTLSLIKLKVINSYTATEGGAIKAEHQGIINLTNCTFMNNVANDGGSVVYSGWESKVTILNCKFDSNVSTANNTERGSTIVLFGPFNQVIKNSEFTNNRGINGGAINSLNAILLIEDCIFTNNRTTDAYFDSGQPNDFLRGFGGALYTDRASQGPPNTDPGTITLRRCRFEGNTGNGEGGACYLYTDATDNVLIDECYFDNNESQTLTGGTNGGSGGAIQHMNNSNNLGFVVRNSTFSNNKAAVTAGAIRVDWADTQISNCTFYNNKALLVATDGYSANGGALAFYSMDNSTADLTNCTFANNSAGWVGGAIVTSHPANTRIKNTVFYQNTASNGGNNWGIQQHSSGELVDLGGNFQFPNKLTNNGNDYNVSASVTIADPLLVALANNGGFSPTMALQAGSPAIDAGNGCSELDQRGATRIGNCDAGAYEFGGLLSVDDITQNKQELVVYPNPSTGDFSIMIPAQYQTEKIKIQIFDLTGNLILEETIGAELLHTVGLKEKGTYFMRTTTENEEFINKLILR